MQRFILGLFAPALVAIAVRLVLFIISFCIFIIVRILEFIKMLSEVPNWIKKFCDFIVDFDTFSWGESWGFWIIVIVFTFIAEMCIFAEE